MKQKNQWTEKIIRSEEVEGLKIAATEKEYLVDGSKRSEKTE